MSNKMNLIIGLKDRRTEIGMSISLYSKPKGRPEQPAKLSKGSLTWYGNRFAAHNQINTTQDLRYKSQPSTTQKFINQRMSWSSIYKNEPNTKIYNLDSNKAPDNKPPNELKEFTFIWMYVRCLPTSLTWILKKRMTQKSHPLIH